MEDKSDNRTPIVIDNGYYTRGCIECRIGTSEPHCQFGKTQVYRCTHCPAMYFGWVSATDLDLDDEAVRQYIYDVHLAQKRQKAWARSLQRLSKKGT